MEAEIRDLLSELEVWGRENDAREQERSKKMLNLEPDTARLIAILVRASQRRCLLEVGTSNGYSTLWLAWAAKSNRRTGDEHRARRSQAGAGRGQLASGWVA